MRRKLEGNKSFSLDRPEALTGGILDSTTFREQINALTHHWPKDRVKITEELLYSWWAVFRDFDTSDFVEGIVRCRGMSRTFPSSGTLELSIREAKRERAEKEHQKRIEEHNAKKAEDRREYSEIGGHSYNGAVAGVIAWWCGNGNEHAEEAADRMRELSKRFPDKKGDLLGFASKIGSWQGGELWKTKNDTRLPLLSTGSRKGSVV